MELEVGARVLFCECVMCVSLRIGEGELGLEIQKYKKIIAYSYRDRSVGSMSKFQNLTDPRTDTHQFYIFWVEPTTDEKKNRPSLTELGQF